MTGRPPLLVRWLGRTGYAAALAIQESMVCDRKARRIPDTLLLLEHPATVTLGRRSNAEHVLVDDAELARRGIERFDSGRGGDVTFHGPGQLVGYPILALEGARRDAHRFLRDLEEVLIQAVESFDVHASRVEGLTGIWVGQEKLAAIGVRLSSGWITSHGFALNVTTDLAGFSTIVPCGIGDRGVTSLDRLTEPTPEHQTVATVCAVEFARQFGLCPTLPTATSERLAIDGARTVC
jgi:lipoyl(octanoyl) transferase